MTSTVSVTLRVGVDEGSTSPGLPEGVGVGVGVEEGEAEPSGVAVAARSMGPQ